MEELEENEFVDWLNLGFDKGWVGLPFCNTHDTDADMTEEEIQEWDEGGDPCQFVLRVKV